MEISSPTDLKSQNTPARSYPTIRSLRHVATKTVTATVKSGPIPSAEELVNYEKSFVGLGTQIIGWTDGEITHRREIEIKTTDAEIKHLHAVDRDAHLGLWLGFIMATELIIVAGIMAYNNMTWASFGLSSTTLVGLTGVFVYGSRKNWAPEPKTTPKTRPRLLKSKNSQ